MRLGKATWLCIAVTIVVALALPASALATFPGRNGKIAFTTQRDGNSEIYSMNADGSGVTRLTNHPSGDGNPAWSPDGKTILFASLRDGSSSKVWIMNADGSNPTLLTPQGGHDPRWYPDGTRFAYVTPSGAINVRTLDGSSDTQLFPPDPPCEIDPDTGVETRCEYKANIDVSPDGSRIVYATYVVDTNPIRPDHYTVRTHLSIFNAPGAMPSWAPDQSQLAFAEYFDDDGLVHSALGTMTANGSARSIVRNDSVAPSWSPEGTKIAFSEGSDIKVVNPDGTGVTDLGQAGSDPDWQPITINAYPRPKGASPMQVSLVPAYTACTSSNSTHGAPLAFPSCNPPDPASAYLTTGTPDANGRPCA